MLFDGTACASPRQLDDNDNVTQKQSSGKENKPRDEKGRLDPRDPRISITSYNGAELYTSTGLEAVSSVQ